MRIIRIYRARLSPDARGDASSAQDHGVRPQCGKCGMDISDRLKKAKAPTFEPAVGMPGMAEAT